MSRVISSLVLGLTTRMRISALRVLGIEPAGGLLADEAVEDVLPHGVRIALAGVPVASTRGADRPDRVSRRHLAVGDLRRQGDLFLRSRVEDDRARRAIEPAEQPARRPLVAVGLDGEAARLGELRVADRAEPAAPAAGPAGVLVQLVAGHAERQGR